MAETGKHPLMGQIDLIAKMEDRASAAEARDALLTDMKALGAPQSVLDSVRRMTNNHER